MRSLNLKASDINVRLRYNTIHFDDSSAALLLCLRALKGTSFHKKIVTKQGLEYAEIEIKKLNVLKSFLALHKKILNDVDFVVNEYLKKCEDRRQRGIQRLSN